MKMDENELLELLQRKEEAAGSYVWGALGTERETALREYHRLPYGNEEDGWSTIVASDIQDTVQWILPALLKVFSSTDKAVSFEPSSAEDVQSAEQATDACNYVFFKQNNGFMVLHTAFTDALTVRNCAVMWRKETQEVVSTQPFKGATPEMLAMLTQDGSEIQEANEAPMMDQQGQPMIDPYTGAPVMAYNGRLKKVEEKTVIKIEAFSPEDLLIERDWTSPLLADCPYVARMFRVTASDLKMMGFDVTPEELRGSDGMDYSADASFRLNKINQAGTNATNSTLDDDTDDDATAEGWLRMEWVFADADGDGIAERLCVYRLKDRILKQEVTSHVPVATFSPVLNAHRWDGMGAQDLVGDLQKLHTELLRQTLNNLYLTNNPRTKVLTDANWSPLANIDDLLDSRPGGVIRQRDPNAVQEHVTPFAAAATMPMLEYVQGMRENRTGVSRTSQGLNADSMNNTATGRQMDMTASMQRVELIARIAAELLLKPIFQGVLKLLTEGGMEKLAFRLRNEFVEYDPNEWRDSYDMSINVGLGSGDKAAQLGHLQQIMQNQMALMPMGLATPQNIYHTQSKMIENAGYKDVQNFLTPPNPNPPPPPPNPELQIEQMKLQSSAQMEQQKMQSQMQADQARMQLEDQQHQREMQRDMEVERNKQMLQAQENQSTKQIEAERDIQKAQLQMQMDAQKIEFERWKAELQAQTQIYLKQMDGGANPVETGGDLNNALATAIDGFRVAIDQIGRPKTIVRDASGRAQGIV